MQDRVNSFENVRNFRDFGGYQGADGARVRTGALFRSAQFGEASEADLAALPDVRGLRIEAFGQGPAHGPPFGREEFGRVGRASSAGQIGLPGVPAVPGVAGGERPPDRMRGRFVPESPGGPVEDTPVGWE